MANEQISKIESEYLVMDEDGYTDKKLVDTVNMLIDKVNELNAQMQYKAKSEDKKSDKMSRGLITEEIKEKYQMTTKEFRLIPYIQYLLVNQRPIDPESIDDEEREILQNWRNKGYLTFSMIEPLTVSREFWDIMNNFLWDCYILQKEKESEEK